MTLLQSPFRSSQQSGTGILVRQAFGAMVLSFATMLNILALSRMPMTELKSFYLQSASKPKLRSTHRGGRDTTVDARIYKEITFTNFGWFHPDKEQGLREGRSWASRDFVDSVLENERFNQSAWHDLHRHPDPSRPILAFLDIETCNYLHYPRFHQDWELASDTDGGRSHIRTHRDAFSRVCPAIDRALESPAMAAPESRLVVLSCEEFGPVRASSCTSGNRSSELYSKVVVGHLSATKNQAHPHDFGIPPKPVKAVALNDTQLDDIKSCRAARVSFASRAFLFSFNGRSRDPFPEYKDYWKTRHGKDNVYAKFGWRHYTDSPNNVSNSWGYKVLEALPPENQTQDFYYRLLASSIFGGAPRGDNLYSVRFPELLSAATIPVVYADSWVLPYNQDVVDWTELAVMLPQKNVNQTMDVLLSMPEEEICARQKRILDFYSTYMADSNGQLRAILKLMDKRLNRAPNDVAKFSAAPG